MLTEFFRNLTLLKCLSVSAFITTPNLCKYLEKAKHKRYQCSTVPNGCSLSSILAALWFNENGLHNDRSTSIVQLWISIEVCAVIFLISLMLLLVQIYGRDIFHPLGFTCMTFNILNFGAPLAGLKVVLRQRSCETLPLPMCIANLLVSSQWALYGILVSDIYIITPNAIGMMLAMIQIALFLIFPMKQGRLSPVQRCFGPSCCAPASSSSSSDENVIDEMKSKKSWVSHATNRNELMGSELNKNERYFHGS
ncbi:Sugar transporter SWEET [Dirofilaria immitis]|nr:Sugar transporter SWEET [Dirofilaria immitis]